MKTLILELARNGIDYKYRGELIICRQFVAQVVCREYPAIEHRWDGRLIHTGCPSPRIRARFTTTPTVGFEKAEITFTSDHWATAEAAGHYWDFVFTGLQDIIKDEAGLPDRVPVGTQVDIYYHIEEL